MTVAYLLRETIIWCFDNLHNYFSKVQVHRAALHLEAVFFQKEGF